jgi:GMP synthase (glutamine-hydrolysing)|tara:strand:+ start:28617 stop:30149 length:1533 start_codon:yes stop_codon:yes gene_type:complete
MEFSKVLILDFGSQVTKLIARNVRELNVYCEIVRFDISINEIIEQNPKCIILSGSPASIYDKKNPEFDKEILSLNIPILGICYGAQLLSKIFKSQVKKSKIREFGPVKLIKIKQDKILDKIPNNSISWMSHGDTIYKPGKVIDVLARSEFGSVAIFKHKAKKIYGTQFHPEVVHTSFGKKFISNFIFSISNCKNNWKPSRLIKSKTKEIQDLVKGGRAISAISGGVDSSVSSVLVANAIGTKLNSFIVDTGLMRKDEIKLILPNLKKLGVNPKVINASKIFLSRLKGVTNPEKKRKIIGKTFIELFEKEAKRTKAEFLVQGTLYPDVIESVSISGPSAVIKSHHNVGGLPKRMKLKLVEPLRDLFKDEVRVLGKSLGIEKDLISRHPFPGPGLAIRILGEINQERVKILQEADSIYINILKEKKLYDLIWQAFCVLIPIKTVGVMGDERTYENTIAIRAVNSTDGMTASWSRIPYDVLDLISSEIINSVKGINKVVFDISNKPPSTIEWE